MNLEIFPSESQVISTSVPWRSGCRVQSVDWHDREQLPERPMIEERLENGKVADVLVAQRSLEFLHFLRHETQPLVQGDDLLRQLPVNTFDLCFALQLEQTEREHLLRFFLDLLRVVQGLASVVAPQLLLHLEHVAHEFVIGLGRDHFRGLRALLDRTEGFHHEDGMMRDDRAPAFAHDRRMRHPFGIAHIHDVPDDVVGVFLERVVGRAIEARA